MARSFGACLRQVRSVSIQMSRRVHELAVLLATSPGTVVTSAQRTVAQRTRDTKQYDMMAVRTVRETCIFEAGNAQ